MSLQFEPLYSKVLVLPTDGQRVVDGVMIPDSAQEDCKSGVVVSTGNGYVHPETGAVRPLSVKRGDAVLFGPYAGIPIIVGGQEYLLMEELEIGGRVKNGTATETKNTTE